MISLYRDLIKGNHPIKRFHLLFFYFHKSSNDAIAIVCIFALFLARKSKKRSFSRNSIFSLLFFEYKRNFYMTLVSDSPHVASLLRINISKFGYALQAFFILRYSPHVASLLRINISKLGFALQALLINAIVLTSLRASGSISLSSVAPYRLTSLRAIEKEHTVHFA